MDDYDSIYRYLESGIYAEGLSKNEKRNLRCKCKKNFKIENGQLFCRKSDRGAESEREPQWKLCLKTEDDKQRMLPSCHSSDTGITFKFGMEEQNSLHNFSTCRRTLGS